MIMLCAMLLMTPHCGFGVFGNDIHSLAWISTKRALDSVPTSQRKVRSTLELWNENIHYLQKTGSRIHDLEAFIHRLLLPIHSIAGNKYCQPPIFMEAYLKQQSVYPATNGMTASGDHCKPRNAYSDLRSQHSLGSHFLQPTQSPKEHMISQPNCSQRYRHNVG